MDYDTNFYHSSCNVILLFCLLFLLGHKRRKNGGDFFPLNSSFKNCSGDLGRDSLSYHSLLFIYNSEMGKVSRMDLNSPCIHCRQKSVISYLLLLDCVIILGHRTWPPYWKEVLATLWKDSWKRMEAQW